MEKIHRKFRQLGQNRRFPCVTESFFHCFIGTTFLLVIKSLQINILYKVVLVNQKELIFENIFILFHLVYQKDIVGWLVLPIYGQYRFCRLNFKNVEIKKKSCLEISSQFLTSIQKNAYTVTGKEQGSLRWKVQ
jgi:hypothetical protein